MQITHNNSNNSVYPIKSPIKIPFLSSASVPVTFFELPYKLYLTPVTLSSGQYYFQHENAKQQFTVGSKKTWREITELYSNELLLSTGNNQNSQPLANSPSFRIIAYADDYGDDTTYSTNESVGKVSTDSTYINTNLCATCDKKLQTAGLLPYGSDSLDAIYRPGVNMATHQNHRSNLAQLSNLNYVPATTKTDRDLHSSIFSITAWGGYAFLNYQNPDRGNYSIISFTERIVLGRDEYIEVITEGYDHFGIKCYYIQVGQVTFSEGNRYVRYYVIIKYPNGAKVDYTSGGDLQRDTVLTGANAPAGSPYVTRPIPFNSITPVTMQTKKLDPARDIIPLVDQPSTTADCVPANSAGAVLIYYNDAPYNMEYSAIDRNNNSIKIVKPLIFIDRASWDSTDPNHTKLQSINRILNEISSVPGQPFTVPAGAPYSLDDLRAFRKTNTFNQKIGIVDLTGVDPALLGTPANNAKANEVQTDSIDFFINLGTTWDDSQLPCLPVLNRASVYLPQLQGLVSTDVNIAIQYAQSFLVNKFNQVAGAAQQGVNTALVFANLTSDTLNNIAGQLADPANVKALGGLVTPDIPIQSISARAQSVTLYENAAINTINNTINPIEILRGANPEIIKGINLLDVLNEFIPLDETPIFNVIQQVDDDIDQTDQAIQQITDAINEVKSTIQTKVNSYINQVKTYEQDLADIANSQLQSMSQRLLKISNEIAYLTRMTQKLVNPKALEADELAYVQNVFTTYQNQVNNTIGKLQASVFAQYQTAGQTIDAARAAATKAFTDYANSAATSLKANTKGFLDAVNAAVGPYLDQASMTISNYAALKTSLLNAMAPIAKFNGQFTSPTSAQLYYQGIFDAATLTSTLNAYLKYAANQYFVQYLHDFNDPGGNALQYANTGDMYTLLTAFLALAEQELNQLKAGSGVDTSGLATLIPILQQQIKLFLAYYTEKQAHLTTELQQLPALATSLLPADAVALFNNVKNFINQPAPGTNTTISQIAQLNKFPLGGFTGGAGGWAAQLAARTLQITNLNGNLNGIISKQIAAWQGDITKLTGQITTLQNQLLGNPPPGLQDVINTLTTTLNTDLQNVLSETGISKQNTQDEIDTIQRFLQYVKQGSTINRTYSWSTTNFRDADLGIIQFTTHTNPQTTLNIDNTATIVLDYSQLPPAIKQYSFSNTSTLKNFSIVFLAILDVNFNYIQFTDATNSHPNLSVKIDSVTFAGSLSFLQTLQSLLSTVDDALKLDIEPDSVSLSYCLPVPDLPAEAGTFGFANLVFNFGVLLPFDGSPLQVSFAIASAANKFRVTLDFFTGWGYFGMTAEPKNGIKSIEIAIEMGVYAGITIGPLTGSVQFSVGLYYGRTGATVLISGYISCDGQADLFGFGVSVSLYMGFTSDGNSCTGQCEVSYSIHLGFFSLDFHEGYSKTVCGSGAAASDDDDTYIGSRERPMLAWQPVQHHAGGPLVMASPDNADRDRDRQFRQYWKAFF